MSSYKMAVNQMVKTAKLLDVSIDTNKVNKLVIHYEQLKSCHGERLACQQLKAYFNETLRFILKEDFQKLTPMWIKRSSNKLPKIVNQALGSLLRSNRLVDNRIALSFLRCYEAITLRPVEDLSTITTPSNGNVNFVNQVRTFDRFLNSSRFAQTVKALFNKFLTEAQASNEDGTPYLHFSAKAGVGGPTIQTAGLQSLALNEQLMYALIGFSEMVFKRQSYRNFFLSSRSTASKGFDFQPCRDDSEITKFTGRIKSLPDKGGKTRIIAIGSYWVQDTLIELHKLAFRILKVLPTDGTFNQEGSFKDAFKASKKGPVWSYDLTAATDRLPLGIQVHILKFLHQELGEYWEKILSNINFVHNGKEIKYEVGQPMGLYGSWSFGLALTHHFIVQYCAWKTYKNYPFLKYAILGDDVAIWDKDVAETYHNFMVNTLCVDISEFKSFKPKDIHCKSCNAEFAKRISNGKDEITPISPLQSTESWNNVSMMPMFIDWLTSRGYKFGTQTPVSTISKIGNYTKYKTTILDVAFHLWRIQRGPFGLNDDVPDHLKHITINDIVAKRIILIDNEIQKMGARAPNYRADVEKSLGTEIDRFHYMPTVMRTRYRALQEVRSRLYLLFGSLKQIAEGESPNVSEDFRISEIEFMPYVNLKDVLSLKRDNQPNKLKYGRFLIRLAKEILKSQTTKY